MSEREKNESPKKGEVWAIRAVIGLALLYGLSAGVHACAELTDGGSDKTAEGPLPTEPASFEEALLFDNYSS